MIRKHEHDFNNDSDEAVSIMVAPGERVRVTEGARPLDFADYDGEEYGNEVIIPPGAKVRVLQHP